jgi:hypothetical protein
VRGSPKILRLAEQLGGRLRRAHAATPTVAVAQVHLRRNGARFGAAVNASPPTAGLGDVSIAADPRSGSLLTGWVAQGGGFAALGARGGPFGAPEPVTPAEGASQLNFVPAPVPGLFTAAWVSRLQGDALAVVREADGQ